MILHSSNSSMDIVICVRGVIWVPRANNSRFWPISFDFRTVIWDKIRLKDDWAVSQLVRTTVYGITWFCFDSWVSNHAVRILKFWFHTIQNYNAVTKSCSRGFCTFQWTYFHFQNRKLFKKLFQKWQTHNPYERQTLCQFSAKCSAHSVWRSCGNFG